MPHAILKRKDWFHSDGFPIAVERREPQKPFGLHAHEFAEIVIVTEGQGSHVTGTESYPLSLGDAFVIGGARKHDYHSMKNLCLVNILFQPDRLDMRMFDLQKLPGYHALFTLEPAWRKRHAFESRLRLSPRELCLVMTLVDQMEAELKSRAPGFGVIAASVFMQIVAYLSRCYERVRNPDSRHLLRIAKAITHLESNAARTVSLDELRGITGMSMRNFMRAFREATGVAPIAYLIELRMNRAATRLRSGDDSITDIAFEGGFSDSNYFTRQFTRKFGMPPRQYRRIYAQECESGRF